MLDRVTGMRVFVRAAQAGSLSAAARLVGMSPAMATKHVDALESRLGVKLFHRSTRRLNLTAAGTSYLEACLRILPEIDEAEASVASQRVEAKGLLRMNVPLSFGTRYVAPLLPAFSRRHPEVSIELGFTDSHVDLIDGNWDMAVRIGRLEDSPLQARRLVADCPMLLCASPGYLAEHGTPRRTGELAQHNCLGYSLSSMGPREWAFGRAGEVRVAISGNLIANNGAALVAAAEGDMGLIYQPTFIVSAALARGTLVALQLDQEPMRVGGVYAVYPPDRRPPAKVRAMVDHLVEAFSGVLPWERQAD